MATNAQITAAVANAQLSTGPRSSEGKAISSMNATKLGLFAQSPILPGEDPEQLAALTREYIEEYKPKTPTERALIDELVLADWFKRRYRRIEAEVIQARFDALPEEDRNQHALGKIFIQDGEGPKLLDKIFRRQQAASRQYRRALMDLREAIAQRVLAEPALAEPAPCPPAARPVEKRTGSEPAPAPKNYNGPTPVRTPRDNWDNPALRL